MKKEGEKKKEMKKNINKGNLANNQGGLDVQEVLL